jgi:rRNA maturation RNase YbeY
LKDYKKNLGSLNYIFCTDNYLLQINNDYLKHNTLTDIITFDYTEGKMVSGEVFISVERVRENAALFSGSFKDELHRVMIHGILHLCGHKDKTPSAKKEMTAQEDYYLSLRSF